jgi:hypothetical protein
MKRVSNTSDRDTSHSLAELVERVEALEAGLEASRIGASPIRTRALVLVNDQGDVCLRLTTGLDGPELSIPADPEVSRETMTASLRTVTGGSYAAIRPIGDRVKDLEGVLSDFADAALELRGGLQ